MLELIGNHLVVKAGVVVVLVGKQLLNLSKASAEICNAQI